MTHDQQHEESTPNTPVDLANFEQEFGGADPEDSDFAPLPDGTYQAVVESVELATSRQGNPMLKWSLRVLGPQHQGRMLWRNNIIAKGKMGYLKGDLMRCGLELSKLSDLPHQLHRLLGVVLEVAQRTKGDYRNVYLNKRLPAEEGAQQTAGESGSGGSALPPF